LKWEEVCEKSYVGPSVLQKAQRNLAVLFPTRFTMLRRSEIHINLKIDIDTGVVFVYVVKCIISIKDNEGSMLVSAHASTVCAVSRIK
jgi:hypothetical protein